MMHEFLPMSGLHRKNGPDQCDFVVYLAMLCG